jgi:hypothetical protein
VMLTNLWEGDHVSQYIFIKTKDNLWGCYYFLIHLLTSSSLFSKFLLSKHYNKILILYLVFCESFICGIWIKILIFIIIILLCLVVSLQWKDIVWNFKRNISRPKLTLVPDVFLQMKCLKYWSDEETEIGDFVITLESREEHEMYTIRYLTVQKVYWLHTISSCNCAKGIPT